MSDRAGPFFAHFLGNSDDGQALLRQSIDTFEHTLVSLHMQGGPEAENIRRRVEAFRQRLNDWRNSAMPEWQNLVALRIAFADLDRSAHHLDTLGHRHIAALRADSDRVYAWSLAGSLLALGLIAGIVLYSTRQEHLAEVEQARLERARGDSEARFARLFHEAPLPLCLVDSNGALRTRNRRFDQTFGYDHDELRDLDDWWLLAYPDPAYRNLMQEMWRAAVADAARSGTDIAPTECRVTCKDGQERVMLVSGIPLGEDFLATFFDISERKQAEQAQAHALAEQKAARRETKRTAANQELDAFAYAISHDLRAPLRAMNGFAQALEEDYGERLDGEAKNDLVQIGLASQRMGDLIEGILTLSRNTRGELRRDAAAPSAAARRQIEELTQQVPQRRVEWTVQPGLVALGDARMLEVVVANLIGNAWKYSAGRAPAHIRCYAEERDGHPWFCVADDGAGYDPAQSARIVHRHGGEIEARGEVGRGATFCFTLADASREHQACAGS